MWTATEKVQEKSAAAARADKSDYRTSEGWVPSWMAGSWQGSQAQNESKTAGATETAQPGSSSELRLKKLGPGSLASVPHYRDTPFSC